MDFKTAALLLLLQLLGFCDALQGPDQGADKESSGKEDITTTILRMNNGSDQYFMEGDIIIPRIRNAMKCLNKPNSCRWPKSASGTVVIPYTISAKYDSTEKHEIETAMKDMESKTCIRFVPRVSQRAYLSIEPRYGCSSMLGRVGDIQVLSLRRYGCVQHGIIQHEILHALGFYHEHTRSDRDMYVKINWENISDYAKLNFKKMDTINLDTPYDYSSLMHYGKTAFAKTGTESITPIYDSDAVIGQREALSEIDIIRINRLYKCHNYAQ